MILLNNKGSSLVLYTILFTVIATMICLFISFSKIKAAESEITSLSVMWSKAILSEYDLNLYRDYGIMAYFGHEQDINNKLNKYCSYTFNNRSSINYEGVKSSLKSHKMILPENINKALKADSLNIFNEEKTIWDVDYEGIAIENEAIIKTLPSKNLLNYEDSNVLFEMIANGMEYEDIINGCAELAYISKHFNNHVYKRTGNECVFRNEWEYILTGKMNDDKNFDSAERRIYVLRNALNLGYLYKDNEKRELTLTIAETICPGPWCLATQFLIMESWALLESKYDIDNLLNGEKVPLIKTDESWHTDISMVLKSDEFLDKLNDEEKNLLDTYDNRSLDKSYNNNEIMEGLDYEEYLFMYLSLMDRDSRLLRIMDLIQINMKLRYYNDFNWQEYNNGIEYKIIANGREYEIEMEY